MTVQFLIDAISLGSLYAVIVIGVALILGIVRLMNFAHGDLVVVGGYSMALLSSQHVLVVILSTIAVTTACALAMERIAFRSVRGASAATLLITSFTVSYLLQNLISATMTSTPRPIVMPGFVLELFDVGPNQLSKLAVLTIAVTAVLVIALAAFLNRTVLGLQMRAAAEDFVMARLVGVRANRVISLAFAVSGGLAGVVALAFFSQVGAVTPTMGVSITLIAFVGTVIGGIGSLVAATTGGFLLGVITVALQAALPVGLSSFRDAFLFTIVIAILLFRPRGLLRRGQAERAL